MSDNNPEVLGFFDPRTFTISYLVIDPQTLACAIVDPVLDYDPKSACTWTESAQRLIDCVQQRGLDVQWILETHAHADHLSAASMLRQRYPAARLAIGEHIAKVQNIFREVFNLEGAFATDGSQFDHLFADGERFSIGRLEGRVLSTPGHTPACMSYCIGDAVFVGDTLFMPDYGTARCDFPGGDAGTLYRSIRRLLELPPATRMFMCHDYPPESRSPRWETSVAAQRADNIHVRDGVSEEEFVAMREQRDATLEMPVLILPSVQVNIRAGEFPPAEANGMRYLKLPINVIGKGRRE